MSIPGYTLIQPFSVTSTGTIWQATNSRGDSCLIRFLDLDDVATLQRRLGVLTNTQSDFVAPVIDVIEEDERLAIVTPLIEGQVLNHWMHLPGARTDVRVRAVLRDIAVGLKDLHDAGIAHGDLSLTNVVVNDSGAVLIDNVLGAGYTPVFAAPEVEVEAEHLPGDVWAWGEIARQLGFQAPVVERALDPDPSRRATIAEVLDAPELRDVAPSSAIPLEADISMVSGGELLRIESLMEQTLDASAGGRHKRARKRGGWRVALANVMVISGLLTLGFWWFGPVYQPQLDQPMQASPTEVRCPTQGEAQSVVVDLTTRRNQAIMDVDADLLDAVIASDSEVFKRDVELIESIEKAGVEIHGLSTAVEDVEVQGCSPLEITAAFTQNEHERCTNGECTTVEQQPANHLSLTFEGPPWRVNDVTSLDPDNL